MNYYFSHFLLLAVFLLLSALFSGTESAFFSIKKSDLYRLSRSTNEMEKSISRYMAQPDKVLITLLLGNLFVNLMLTALATSFLLTLSGTYGHFISIGFVTPLIILFGEITPKILAINLYLPYSRGVFPFFRVFHKLLAPLRYVILYFTDTLIKIFKLQMTHSSITADELGYVVSSGEKLGIIDKKESEIIKNVIMFSRREAGNIMYPRTQAIFIQEGYSIQRAMEVIIENDITRVPVYKNDYDNITGFIDSRDILSSYLGYKKNVKINRYVRPVEFFPYSKDLNELLHDFLKKKLQIAIIVDEYGGTAGIVTLNSILSALLGKEFGRWETSRKNDIRIVDEYRFTVPGDLQIDEFNGFFSTVIESIKSDTIGGYVIEKLISFPSKGDVIRVENLEIRVKSISKRSIRTLEVTVLNGGAHHND